MYRIVAGTDTAAVAEGGADGTAHFLVSKGEGPIQQLLNIELLAPVLVDLVHHFDGGEHFPLAAGFLQLYLGGINQSYPHAGHTFTSLEQPLILLIRRQFRQGLTERHGVVVALAGEIAHLADDDVSPLRDRKSTRLNSSHVKISYAV